MIFTALPLAGAYRIDLDRRGDERGWFARTYCADEFAGHGLCTTWVQSNLSFSAETGTLRGLHYQRPPAEEIKLVRCSRGRVWDVIVDLRAGSGTYGCWHAEELDDRSHAALYVPAGFAHGFQTLSDDVEMTYQHSTRYSPAHEGGVIWNDPELAIAWPLPITRQSDRDLTFPRLTETEPLAL